MWKTRARWSVAAISAISATSARFERGEGRRVERVGERGAGPRSAARRAGQLGDHQEALQLGPRARSARRRRRPRARRCPGARARSRWAHSAARRRVPAAGVDQGRRAARARAAGSAASGRPAAAASARWKTTRAVDRPCLAWSRSRLSRVMTVASRSAGSAARYRSVDPGPARRRRTSRSAERAVTHRHAAPPTTSGRWKR